MYHTNYIQYEEIIFIIIIIIIIKIYPFAGYSPFYGELAHNMLIYCQEII